MQDEKALKDPNTPTLPDAQYRITLLMIMALLMLPISLSCYSIAVIAIIKGQYGVNSNVGHETAQWIGFAGALGVTIYLILHWYVIIRYYRAFSRHLFGMRHFFILYGLQVLNVLVFAFAVTYNLYHLPIYMIPFGLFCINCYLIYLRRHCLSGKTLT